MDTAAEGGTVIAKAEANIPVVSNEERQSFITDLDERIEKSQANLEMLIGVTANLDTLTDLSRPQSLEQLQKAQETNELTKSAREELQRSLVELILVRELADTSPKRLQKLVDRIIDRYREQQAPMYERSFVVEQVGAKARVPAAQLASEVSDKIIYGWYERYDVKWMVNDANEYANRRIDEIVANLAMGSTSR